MIHLLNELRTVAKIAGEYKPAKIASPAETQYLTQVEKIGEDAAKTQTPKLIHSISKFIANRIIAFRSVKKSRPIKMPDYAKFYSNMEDSKENMSILNRLSRYIINKLEDAHFARKSRPITRVADFSEEYFSKIEQMKKAMN